MTLDRYTKGLLAVVLTAIVGNSIYQVILDEIVCAGSRELQEAHCKNHIAHLNADIDEGKTITENPEARHDCWCAYNT